MVVLPSIQRLPARDQNVLHQKNKTTCMFKFNPKHELRIDLWRAGPSVWGRDLKAHLCIGAGTSKHACVLATSFRNLPRLCFLLSHAS
jgi:hypothetical protein